MNMDEKTDRVYCVFEGGGAKGVAHVGVLAAIQNHTRYRAKGFAGTSAGAIVASLAAVGWTSDELLKKSEAGYSSPALDKIGLPAKSLADLIGPDWKKVRRLRGVFAWLKRVRTKADRRNAIPYGIFVAAVFFWPIIYFMIRFELRGVSPSSNVSALIPRVLFNLVIAPALWVIYAATLLITLGYLYHYFMKFTGFAKLAHTVNNLDKLYACKVPPSNGARVTFQDLRDADLYDLKIVAANIHTGQMKLFDAKETPNVAISDAVAASAAIPLIFKPMSIGGSQYCDGGIVSNLPAWTFEDSLMLDDECIVVTSELSEKTVLDDVNDAPPVLAKRGFGLIESVARTAAFGSGSLNTRGIRLHVPLQLDSTVRLLDFERTAQHATIIEDAEKTAKGSFDLFDLERDTLDGFYPIVCDQVNSLLGKNCDLRVALMSEYLSINGNVIGYRVWHTAGFNGSPDCQLCVPADESLTGRAIREKSPLHLDLCTFDGLADFSRIFPSGERSLFFPKGRKWIVVVPLSKEAQGKSHGRAFRSSAVAFDGGVEVADFDQLKNNLRDCLLEHTALTPY